MNPFYLGKGTVTSAMSEKVRTRLEELDDFEEVSKSFAERREEGLVHLLQVRFVMVTAL